MLAAVLLLGGGATATVMLVSQANQAAAAHEKAITKHSAALSAYENAWAAFEEQDTDTRDDLGKLSSTSLDNSEEVMAAFDEATAAADALEQTEFAKLEADATDKLISAETELIKTATTDVEKVTQQLADASTLFNDSYRGMEVKNLTNMIENAKDTLAAEKDRADADLAAKLEKAIKDAQTLADDPKAHTTDLRDTAEALVTLTGEVKDSAGPSPDDVTGSWVIPQAGGTKLEVSSSSYEYGTRAGVLEFIRAPGPDDFESTIIDSNPDCLFFKDRSASNPRRSFFVFCPVGTGKDSQNPFMPGTDVERLTWFDFNQATPFVRG